MPASIDWKRLRLQLLGNPDSSLIPPTVEIPRIPTVVSEVCRRAKDPNCSADDLARLLESDVSLVCDLLKYVNSAAMGVRTRASTIKQAVALLGINKTRMFVVTTVLEQQMQKQTSPLVVARLFCLAAMERALAARMIAEGLHQDADVAFAGALIQDFMLPSLTLHKITEYAAMRQKLADGSEELHNLEETAFGWNHAYCGAVMMLQWGLPDELICCGLLHHRLDKIWAIDVLRNSPLTSVAATSWLPDVLSPSLKNLPRFVEFVETRCGLEVSKLAQSVNDQLRELSPNLDQYQTLLDHLGELQLVGN